MDSLRAVLSSVSNEMAGVSLQKQAVEDAYYRRRTLATKRAQYCKLCTQTLLYLTSGQKCLEDDVDCSLLPGWTC